MGLMNDPGPVWTDPREDKPAIKATKMVPATSLIDIQKLNEAIKKADEAMRRMSQITPPTMWAPTTPTEKLYENERQRVVRRSADGTLVNWYCSHGYRHPHRNGMATCPWTAPQTTPHCGCCAPAPSLPPLPEQGRDAEMDLPY